MDKRHICSLCDRSFGRKYDLKRHENTTHAEDENSNEESEENEDSEVDVALSQTIQSILKQIRNMMNLKMKILNPTLKKKMTLETMMYIKNGFSRHLRKLKKSEMKNTRNISTRV